MKYQAPTPNHEFCEVFGLVFITPIHIGLIFVVKKPATNFSCLDLFNDSTVRLMDSNDPPTPPFHKWHYIPGVGQHDPAAVEAAGPDHHHPADPAPPSHQPAHPMLPTQGQSCGSAPRTGILRECMLKSHH
jgi:hypothetical protein